MTTIREDFDFLCHMLAIHEQRAALARTTDEARAEERIVRRYEDRIERLLPKVVLRMGHNPFATPTTTAHKPAEES